MPCSDARTTSNYFILAFSVLFLICSIWMSYRYISNHNPKQKKQEQENRTKKYQHIITLAFYGFTVLFFVSNVVWYIERFISSCQKDPMSVAAQFIWSINIWAEMLQFLCLVMVSFGRLYIAFQTSTLAMSKCSIIAFVVLCPTIFALGTVSFLYRLACWSCPMAHTTSLIAFAVFLLTAIWTSILFVFKLCTTKKHFASSKSYEIKLFSFIIRYTILSVFAITTMLIFMFFATIAGLIFPCNDCWVGICNNSLLPVVVFTNCLCISLAQTFNDKYYATLCGMLDGVCKLCVGYADVESQLQTELTVKTETTTDTKSSKETET
eukprot:455944_1